MTHVPGDPLPAIPEPDPAAGAAMRRGSEAVPVPDPSAPGPAVEDPAGPAPSPTEPAGRPRKRRRVPPQVRWAISL
ncbi:MAG: hypothetical protein ACRDYZ_02345, partial [Acidimicrobiales bacterium]